MFLEFLEFLKFSFKFIKLKRSKFLGGGLHNIHGSFNIQNMSGALNSRNSTINSVPSGGVQQPTGTLSSGRFASNNLPVALSQVSFIIRNSGYSSIIECHVY